MVCSDHLEAADITPPATKPDAGKEFIEGIREGLEDFAEGRYEVFDDVDELLARLSEDP